MIQKRAQIPKIDYDLYTGVTVVPLSEMISTHGSVLHIETQPWQAYRVPSTSVYARVSIAYRNTNIYLVFDVFEQQILAEKHMHNQMVCEDSCVEMFLSCSPDSRDKSYVNFEFNPLGRCYAGTGTDRNDRTLFPPQLIETIRVTSLESSTYKNDQVLSAKLQRWGLLVEIPLPKFGICTEYKTLENISLRANFFKCGDNLKNPHFLVWNTVGTFDPDFHQPDYFGIISFL